MHGTRERAERGGEGDRLAALLLALGCAFVLCASRLLTPDASGVGTHTQLGLPACGFLVLFGKPCPACGLTTAFAHLAHGSLLSSLRAHPLGLPLFVASGALLALSLRALWRGDSLGSLLAEGRLTRVALSLCLGLFVVWIARLIS